MDPITTDQIGSDEGNTYGADVGPTNGMDMWAFDGIVGFPTSDRDASQADFTGGMGGKGLGGVAEPMTPGGVGPDGTLYERKGF